MIEHTLEVHAAEAKIARELDLLEALQDAIDLASDQDKMTWLLGRGKRIAAIVPVEQAERGQITVEQRATLTQLADRLFRMVNQKVAPRGQEITRDRWEISVRAVLAQTFQQGMGVGWDKHAAASDPG
jgi:hypothetical protein